MSALPVDQPQWRFDDNPRTRGVAVEAKLQAWGIEYVYVEEYSLDAIQVVESAQVRDSEHRTDPDTVKEYREQMGAGAVFPPILLMDPNLLIDGNTRKQAAVGLKRKSIPAFVAKFPTVDLAKAFAGSLNQENGRRLSRDEARRNAMALLDAGYADESVSREIGYNASQVRRWRLEMEYAARARRTRVQEHVSELGVVMTPGEQQELAKVRNEPLFAEAVKMAADLRPKKGLLNEMVRRVAEAPSEADGLRVLEEIRAEWKPAGPPPHRPVVIPNELKSARMALPQLARLAGSASMLFETDEKRREQAVAQWEQVLLLAQEMLALYGAGK